MAKVKCIMCGAECCTCNGCNPKTYVDKKCPSCQKKENNANSENTRMSGVWELESSAEISRMQPAELTS